MIETITNSNIQEFKAKLWYDNFYTHFNSGAQVALLDVYNNVLAFANADCEVDMGENPKVVLEKNLPVCMLGKISSCLVTTNNQKIRLSIPAIQDGCWTEPGELYIALPYLDIPPDEKNIHIYIDMRFSS